MKFLILIVFWIIAYQASAQNPFYFGNNEAVNLTNGIRYQNGIKNIAGNLDPTVSAVNSATGSLYESTNGNLYIKKDGGLSTNWELVNIGSPTSTPDTFAGFDSAGDLYSLPSWSFVPHLNGVTSNVTTDGSAQVNLERLNFVTSLGDSISGNATSYVDAAFFSSANTGYTLGAHTGILNNFNANAGSAVTDHTGLNLYVGGTFANNVTGVNANSGADAVNDTGIQTNATGNTSNLYQGVRVDKSGTANGMYGVAVVNQATISNQLEMVSLSNSGTTTNNVFGVNINNSGPSLTGQISLFNAANYAASDTFSGVNIFNDEAIASSIQGFGFYNNPDGDTGNFQGMFVNNQGDSNSFVGNNITNSGHISQYGQMINLSDTSSSATASMTMAQINASGLYDTLTGINISLDSATTTSGRAVGLGVDNGSLNTNVAFQTTSSLPSVIDNGNSIVTQFNVISGSPITDTSILGNNLAGLADFQDNHDADPFYGLGYAMVGFVGQVGVAATKTVEKVSMALGGASVPVTSTGGTVQDVTVFDAAGVLPAGGTLTVDNLHGFKARSGMCAFGTDCYGVSIEDASADNFLDKSLQIGGTKAPLNSSTALKIADKKAIEATPMTNAEISSLTSGTSALAYSSTDNEWKYFDGSVWSSMGSASITSVDLATQVSAIGYATGSVLFIENSAVVEDNTNLFYDNTNDYLRVKNEIQLGSVDPFARHQIWNYGNNATLRLGSLGQDGDPTDVNSEGIVAYGANSQGTAINSGTGDFGYARVKADRFGLYTSIANTAFYYWRVDPTELYLKNDSNVKTFNITRSTGLIDTTLGAGFVKSDASGILSATSSVSLTADVSGILPFSNLSSATSPGVVVFDGSLVETVPYGATGTILSSNGDGTYSFITAPAGTRTVSAHTINFNAVCGSIHLTLNAITASLPAPSSGCYITIKKRDGSTVTVGRNGSESIDGNASNLSLTSDWESIDLVSDGTDWFII